MSERGILRIVVEGDDAQLFHDGLTEFITESKENPNYRIEDPSGELYWCVGEYDGSYKSGEAICIDCYTIEDRYKGSAVIIWVGRKCLIDYICRVLKFSTYEFASKTV